MEDAQGKNIWLPGIDQGHSESPQEREDHEDWIGKMQRQKD
jgi:hypothetical protein